MPMFFYHPFPLVFQAAHRSACSDSRPGVDVARRHGVVQVELDAGVGGLVRAGERDQAGRPDGPGAARDADLRAREVELRAPDGGRAVQGDVLHAEEVLAVCDAGGDADVYLGFAWFCL